MDIMLDLIVVIDRLMFGDLDEKQLITLCGRMALLLPFGTAH